MPELAPSRISAQPAEVAEAFVVAAKSHGIDATAELVGVLLAQSALETGHWRAMYNFNFGNVKATDAWVANGNDFTFFDWTRPGALAPVSENLTKSQMLANQALSKMRTDGSGLMDMKVGAMRTDGRYTCWFWPSHVQTRFRAFRTLADGASAYLAKLTGKYAGALAPAAKGDVLGYVTQLRKLGPYFTADFQGYYRAVLSLYHQYLPMALAAVGDETEDGIEVDGLALLPNTGAFRTAPEDIEVREEGWIKLASGVEVTRLPLWDRKYNLAARIGFGPVSEWLKARGMRLLTQAEMDELHQLSHFVPPVTKVLKESDTRHMMSHRWCAEHDAEVWDRLRESGWDGAQPVVNFGKHWIAPVGTIYGWWHNAAPSTTKIQNPSDFHKDDPTYGDYATNAFAARDPHVGDGATISQPQEATPLELSQAYEPLWDFPLNLRLCHWLGYQLGLDPREIIGPEHDPLILSYSEHARRGGTFRGVKSDGSPDWVGGYPLKAPSDEWSWCAYGRSEGLRVCLRPGETPCHGMRAAVHELVSDARAAGRLHLAGSGYVPKPGDAAVSGRNGQSPLHGGQGHVDTLIQRLGDNLGSFIGGNEDGNTEHGGRWRYEVQTFDHVEAWIET